MKSEIKIIRLDYSSFIVFLQGLGGDFMGGSKYLESEMKEGLRKWLSETDFERVFQLRNGQSYEKGVLK